MESPTHRQIGLYILNFEAGTLVLFSEGFLDAPQHAQKHIAYGHMDSCRVFLPFLGLEQRALAHPYHVGT